MNLYQVTMVCSFEAEDALSIHNDLIMKVPEGARVLRWDPEFIREIDEVVE